MLTIAKIRKQLDGHSGAGPQTNKSYKFQTSEYIMERKLHNKVLPE